jgi:hypothetical protein
VIGDLGFFDTDLADISQSPFAKWPIPSVARVKGTWIGALDLSNFIPPQFRIDKDCSVHKVFPKELQKPWAALVDAFLYVGPQDLRLQEQTPPDVVLDNDYMRELDRRAGLPGSPDGAISIQKQLIRQIMRTAENPFQVMPKPPDFPAFSQACLDRTNSGGQQQ